MKRIQDVIAFLDELAPGSLAEAWDNVGLLIGHRDKQTAAVMTCLTLTLDVAREAIEKGARLIVAHHPLLFRPVQRLTADTHEGAMLLELIEAGVAVYSPHTGYDSAMNGINRQLAERLSLTDIQPLRPATSTTLADNSAVDSANVGGGRWGKLSKPMTLLEVLELVKSRLKIEALQYVGDDRLPIDRLAIACGSAAEFIPDAARHGCQALLLGEARFHALLEAEAEGVALILAGHYASERPAMESLAKKIADEFSDLTVWASERERDPLRWG